MKRISLYLSVILVAACIDSILALECGIDKGSNQRELRQMAENCMEKKTEETEKPSSEDSEYDESPERSTTDSYKSMKRYKRNDNNNNTNHETTGNTTNKNIENSTTTIESDNCVVHCVFRQMSMLDSNGFPEHNRVSQALLRNANGRELRDFIQDTTDECFQLMDQGEKQDPCQYSVTLVNCLAERGKSNCADWPIGNLSFLSKN